MSQSRARPWPSGAVLGRIDDTGVRDSYTRHRAALTTADSPLELARAKCHRSHALAEAGAIADRDLEQADWNLSSAQKPRQPMRGHEP